MCIVRKTAIERLTASTLLAAAALFTSSFSSFSSFRWLPTSISIFNSIVEIYQLIRLFQFIHQIPIPWGISSKAIFSEHSECTEMRKVGEEKGNSLTHIHTQIHFAQSRRNSAYFHWEVKTKAKKSIKNWYVFEKVQVEIGFCLLALFSPLRVLFAISHLFSQLSPSL